MIELTLRVSECDLAPVVDKFLPELMETLQSSGEMNPLLRLACKSPEASAKIVGGIISAMPKRSQEQLLVKLLNSNEHIITEKLTEFARNENLGITIDSAKAESW